MQLRAGTIAAYARYSSDKQNESSIDDQLRKLRSFAAIRGREIAPSHILTDEAVSGASLARPGFERLMDMVRRREVDVVLVEDTSRLSRDNADALSLFKTFSFYGVQLVAISDGIDSGAKGAKLAYSVKALMSDRYLEDLRDKTLRGMEGRAHAGLATGGRAIGYRSVEVPGSDPRKPQGYRLEIDEVAAAVVRQIFEMWVSGDTRGEIARKLNHAGVPSPRDFTKHQRKFGWSDGTNHAILTNERYRGVFRFNERCWVKVPGTNKRVPRHNPPAAVITQNRPDLAIIDDEIWFRAQKRIQDTLRRFTFADDGQFRCKMARKCKVHPFSGILQCGCGAPMTIHGGYAKRRYYACVSGRRGRCKYHASIREDIVARCVLDKLIALMADEQNYARVQAQIAKEFDGRSAKETKAQKRRERAAELEQKLSRIVSALGDEDCAASLSDGLRALEIELAATREVIRVAESAPSGAPTFRSHSDVVLKIGEIREKLQTAPTQARETLRQLCAGGVILLRWNSKGYFVASLEIVPAVLMVESPQLLASLESRVCLRANIKLY
jgi:site-specific DNA recombinase